MNYPHPSPLPIAGEGTESAVEVGLVRAGRLRHVSSLEGSVLRSAFEGRL